LQRHRQRSEENLQIIDAGSQTPAPIDCASAGETFVDVIQPVNNNVYSADERSLDLARWSLVPYWAKDSKVDFANINAKAKGIENRPAFREAFQRRQCLVPVDNFYGWRKTATGKQPYAIALADRGLMALAGLWENWRSPAGEWVWCFAVVT
jgi:putative SOS response-associated peptidase YedK